MRPLRPLGTAVVVLAAFVAAACAEPASPEGRAPALSTSSTQTLLACENTVERSASATITPQGGTVSVQGVTVDIPAGAVLAPTEIGVRVPAGRFLLADIDAAGFAHFRFEAPITVTMDYAGCPPGQIGQNALSVWYVGDDGAMLERMPTLDDRAKKRVTFLTGHLSGYAIAN